MVLLDMAKDAHVFLMEAYMYRVHPQTFNILDHLDIFKDSDSPI